MAKNKYCYVIVDKENAKMLTSSFPLPPIYTDKSVAKAVCKNFTGFGEGMREVNTHKGGKTFEEFIQAITK